MGPSIGKHVVLVAVLCASATSAACTSQGSKAGTTVTATMTKSTASAPPKPSRHKSTPPPQPHEPVSRPNLSLTPGAVVTTDVNQVCASPLRQHVRVSRQVALVVWHEYGIVAPSSTNLNPPYILDFLVPLTLGGATTADNVWPAARTGIGFKDKQQLATKLRTLVCQSKVALSIVQRLVKTDWYQLWLQYIYRA